MNYDDATNTRIAQPLVPADHDYDGPLYISDVAPDGTLCYDCDDAPAAHATHFDASPRMADDVHLLCTPCRNSIFA